MSQLAFEMVMNLKYELRVDLLQWDLQMLNTICKLRRERFIDLSQVC